MIDTRLQMPTGVFALADPAIRVIDGAAYPLSRAGLVSALDDLPSCGGVVMLPPGRPLRFESAEPVLILKDDVTLIGHPSSPLIGPEEGDGPVIAPYGHQGPGMPIRTRLQRFATALWAEGDTAWSIGDMLLLRDPSDQHSHISIVTGLGPDGLVEFADPLSDPFDPERGVTLHKVAMRRNIRVRLWLDGEHCTGSVTGFGASFCRDGAFEIHAENFHSRNSSGAYDNYGYANSWQGSFGRSGNMNTEAGFSSSAFEVQHCTRTTVRDLRIAASPGFGFSAGYSNHALFENVTTSYTRGHGIKIGGSLPGSQCADCRISHCAVSYVGLEPSRGTSESGIAYASGSHDIVETACRVSNCTWHGWEACDDTVHDIVSLGLVALNNGLLDPGVGIAAAGYRLVFGAALFDSRIDRAIGTLWDGRFAALETARAVEAGETAILRKTIAGGTLGADRGLRLELGGVVHNTSGRAQLLIFRLRFGPVLAAACALVVPSAAEPRPLQLSAALHNAGTTDRQTARLSLSIGAAVPDGGLEPADAQPVDPVPQPSAGQAFARHGTLRIDTARHQEFAVGVVLAERHAGLAVEPEGCSLVLEG